MKPSPTPDRTATSSLSRSRSRGRGLGDTSRAERFAPHGVSDKARLRRSRRRFTLAAVEIRESPPRSAEISSVDARQQAQPAQNPCAPGVEERPVAIVARQQPKDAGPRREAATHHNPILK